MSAQMVYYLREFFVVLGELGPLSCRLKYHSDKFSYGCCLLLFYLLVLVFLNFETDFSFIDEDREERFE